MLTKWNYKKSILSESHLLFSTLFRSHLVSFIGMYTILKQYTAAHFMRVSQKLHEFLIHWTIEQVKLQFPGFSLIMLIRQGLVLHIRRESPVQRKTLGAFCNRQFVSSQEIPPQWLPNIETTVLVHSYKYSAVLPCVLRSSVRCRTLLN